MAAAEVFRQNVVERLRLADEAAAGQTANASDEIVQQVAGIQSSTKGAVSVIREIADTLNDIDRATQAIAASDQLAGEAGHLFTEVTRFLVALADDGRKAA